MLALAKIFTTVSSTAFVHMRRYSQHKMKVLRAALKKCCRDELQDEMGQPLIFTLLSVFLLVLSQLSVVHFQFLVTNTSI